MLLVTQMRDAMTDSERMNGRIAVFGAGAVGGFVGGALAAGGAPVVMIGRAATAQAMAREGVRISDYRGRDDRVPPARVSVATEASAVAGCGLVLVCVKSRHTAEAGQLLAPWLSPSTVVISLQNGVHNTEVLREALPGVAVLAGMVGFNVVVLPGGRYHQATEGELQVHDHAALAPWLPAFDHAGLALHRHADLRGVQWAKLMLNLNNAVNALSGLPLRAQLAQRGYRRVLAAAQQEFLALHRAAGLPPLARLSPLPARMIPCVLRLPDPLFRAIAGRMLRIDPSARSSTADDLAQGRPTEVDWINGEVVRLAESLGRDAPVNRALTRLVHEAETSGLRRQSAEALLDAVRGR